MWWLIFVCRLIEIHVNSWIVIINDAYRWSTSNTGIANSILCLIPSLLMNCIKQCLMLNNVIILLIIYHLVLHKRSVLIFWKLQILIVENAASKNLDLLHWRLLLMRLLCLLLDFLVQIWPAVSKLFPLTNKILVFTSICVQLVCTSNWLTIVSA